MKLPRAVATAVTVVVALSTLASPALAQRHASHAEKRSIARALNIAPRCITAWVSTVDGRWGKSVARDIPDEDCLRASELVVLRRVAPGVWRPRYQGFSDPTTSCRISRGHVPARVAADLRICGE